MLWSVVHADAKNSSGGCRAQSAGATGGRYLEDDVGTLLNLSVRHSLASAGIEILFGVGDEDVHRRINLPGAVLIARDKAVYRRNLVGANRADGVCAQQVGDFRPAIQFHLSRYHSHQAPSLLLLKA